MAGEKEEISPDQRRREWLKRIAEKFEKIEPFAPEWNLSDENCPPWIANVERKFGEDTFPLAKLKTSKVLTPRLLGAILGQQCAYAVWLMDWLYAQTEEADSESELTLTEDDVKKVQAFLESFDKWYFALKRLAKTALCSSVDQHYGDMSEFLLAYSAGFAKKPTGNRAANLGSTTFEIHIFLLLYWRYVQSLNSVSELHLVLRKVFGEYRTGDLKRIEKICGRVGLHFAKPGRPKKPR